MPEDTFSHGAAQIMCAGNYAYKSGILRNNTTSFCLSNVFDRRISGVKSGSLLRPPITSVNTLKSKICVAAREQRPHHS